MILRNELLVKQGLKLGDGLGFACLELKWGTKIDEIAAEIDAGATMFADLFSDVLGFTDVKDASAVEEIIDAADFAIKSGKRGVFTTGSSHRFFL